ncbi:hypothetical protein [Paenibacillus naphthalenovorans]|uniref:hypothetical protein n=1 Tax=Paenibacillus naphthalenovorans TaxID=162209 RepID=UPI003D2CDCFE
MSVRLKGLKEAQKAFQKRVDQLEDYTSKAFTEIILDLTGKSVALAPVDNGDLRGSGKGEINGVVIAEGEKNGSIKAKGEAPEAEKLEGIVSFNTPYALRQHEELTWNHPQGGQAKYLEQPFVQNQNKYIKHLADSVKKAVE